MKLARLQPIGKTLELIETQILVKWKDTPIWGWLLLIVLVYLCRAWANFDRPIAPDAALVYLPYAKRLFDEGTAFFLNPESVYVPPISYLWPAIFGGDVNAVKVANLVGGIFMVLLTYGIGRRAHSHVAGLIAALMFAISPFLVSWIPTALSEPPFFLFTLLWLWGVSEVISGNKWAMPIAVIGLTLSILTRSIWLYPSVLLLAFALAWSIYKPSSRHLMSRLAIVQMLGLIVPVAVIAKNMLLFNLPAIDTGTGGALFYGAHTITNGFEPPLLGLNYENGNDSRSLQGNKEHALVAMQFLKERSLAEIAEWYAGKVSWVLLFSKLEMPVLGSIWRVLELSMAITSIWWGIKQKNFIIILLGSGVALQVLQTSLVLYNVRYSIDNVELLLIPLAAAGFMVMFNAGKGRQKKLLITLLGSAVVLQVLQTSFILFNLPYSISSIKLWLILLAAAGVVMMSNTGKEKTTPINDSPHLNGNSDGNQYGMVGVSTALMLLIALQFRDTPTIIIPPQIPVLTIFKYQPGLEAHAQLLSKNSKASTPLLFEQNVPRQVLPRDVLNAVWQISVAVKPASDKRCKKATIKFIKTEQGSIVAVGEANFDLIDDGVSHTYNLGTAYQNAGLFPATSGKLILAFSCPSDTTISVNQVALIAPQIIDRYFNNTKRDTPVEN